MTALGEVLERPIAHRGLHDLANGVFENSASAFERAIEGNYAIECDINLSGDDVPMVIHDASIERVTGQRGNVADLSAGQIGQIPLKGSATGDTTLRLTELLELVDGRVALAVEIKNQPNNDDEKLVQEATRIVRNYHGPLAFISFSPEILTLTRKFGFKGPTGVILDRFTSNQAKGRLSATKRFIMRHLLHLPKTRFDFIDCDHNALNLPAVRFLRMLGFPVAAWTLTSQQQADLALKYCDQIAFEGYIPRRD